jgi:hypothetical protein
MTDKLEALVARLEKAVVALEGKAGGAHAGGSRDLAYFAPFNKELDHFIAAAKALNIPEVLELTEAFVHSFKASQVVATFASQTPKPSATDLGILQSKVCDPIQKIDKKHGLNKSYGIHCKAVVDAANAALWPFSVMSPHLIIIGIGISSLRFEGCD